MTEQKNSSYDLAFPHAPLRTEMGAIILQPGLNKLELFTKDILCAVITNGQIWSMDDEIERVTAINWSIKKAKLAIRLLDMEAAKDLGTSAPGVTTNLIV